MSLSTAIPLPEAEIAAICRRHGVRELAVFGSVLREDFRPDSDVDLLVDFVPEARATLFTIARLKYDLQDLLQREVDVLSIHGLNPVIEKQVLDSARVIYALG